MRNWTEAQSNAINANGCNILVSAAAGSGKTAVLVQRVIRLITDESLDVDIDRLLIVTFTNAAAAEMKSRISAALDELIRKEPNNTNALKQRALLPNAKICTIDSFCINLVREYFFRLNIAQDFTVLEESQKAVIEQNVIDSIVERLYEENDEGFKSLVELLSETENDNDLIKCIKRIDNYITAHPFPFDWLDEVCEFYNPEQDINKSEFKAFAVNELKKTVDYALELIDFSALSLPADDEMYEKYTEMLDADRNEFLHLRSVINGTWDEIRNAVFSVGFKTAPSKKGYESDAKRIIFADRDIYKFLISSEAQPYFKLSESDIRENNAQIYPVFTNLIGIVKEFHKKCLEAKREMNAYSFSDIEHFAIELLFCKDEKGNVLKSDIAYEYENNYYEILVDEYQDTNTAQDKLFEMLSNGHNRFMVGDVKQSIYRFRLAMPQIFNTKKDSFSPYSKDNTSDEQKIILEKNFRSNEEICGFVNYVFSLLMSKTVGELDYGKDEYLYCGSDNGKAPAPAVHINIADAPAGEKTDEYEARLVAKSILDMVNGGEPVREGETVRAVNYGDIAVLLRSTKNRIDIFSKVFSEFGIPVVSNNRTNLFENSEVSVLLSLLRTIDNPTLDIPLLATLMSVFYGYSADDIASARIKCRDGNLYSAICADGETFSAVLNDLERYRTYASSMSVECLIRQILSETSYLSVISAMGNYEQRRLNVMKLISLAKAFDSGESVGLTVFIRFIDSIIENKIDYESADIGSYAENCVSIMSVHKSKGLEFPVVILAGSAHDYNTDDLKSLVLLNNDYGAGFKMVNEESLSRYETVQYNCIKGLNTYSLMSENLRVLYVAITRAKDRFISFSTYNVNNYTAASHINSISNKVLKGSINPFTVKHIKNDADLLLLCALLHPNGEELRQLCDNDIPYLINEKSALSVNYISDADKPEKTEIKKAPFNADIVEQIKDKLSFEYKNAEIASFASKRIASSLDEKEQSYKFFASKVPSFITGDRLSGAEMGTAVHTFMQYCDFKKAYEDLNAEIKRLTDCGFITKEQAHSINKNKLNGLFKSELTQRIINSDKLYREYSLSSFVPLNKLENTDSTEEVLVIGVADCVFEEDGELVLVDYKTDSVNSEEELLNLYKNQVAFYKSALEKTLNKRVKETLLYSFSLEKCCVYK